MSVQAPTEGLKVYEAGSEAPATWYQSWAWNTDEVPGPATLSASIVHPAGAVTVTGSASTSSAASSRSPCAVPAGFATVVPLVTVDLARKVGGDPEVVKVASLDVAWTP